MDRFSSLKSTVLPVKSPLLFPPLVGKSNGVSGRQVSCVRYFVS
jgi:hypothetical protein